MPEKYKNPLEALLLAGVVATVVAIYVQFRAEP
jgi:hypothetical protein